MSQNGKLIQFTEALRRQLPLLAERYQVESLGVFGSYTRSEQRTDSDLDILVSFREPSGLLKFIEMKNHLSDIFEIKVDLVMKDKLKPHIGEHIPQEVVTI